MPLPLHLVGVWNPSYAADAMQVHTSLLLDKELADESRELQFYLTDYRSLFVADVGSVTRDDVRKTDPEHDADELNAVADGKSWAEFDAEQGGVGAMERELRENLMGDAWGRLDPASRVILASAEKMFRDHRDEPGFDFCGVLGLLAKALETEVNARLHAALQNADPDARFTNLGDAKSSDLSTRRLTLGQLVTVLTEGNAARARVLNERLREGQWFGSTLGLVLEDFTELRNSVTHESHLAREDALAWRNRLLGIGCDGVFARLARVEAKAR